MRDEWDEADARGESKPVFTRTADGGWAVVALDPAQLVAARATLLERIDQLRAGLSVIEDAEQRDEPRPQYGKRIGDHTSEALETRRNAAAADTLRLQLSETERALAKLDEGSYGRCDGCGGPIGAERLEALPWAAECIDCRSGKSGHGRQIRHRWP
jgi:DnaK suppressor protein